MMERSEVREMLGWGKFSDPERQYFCAHCGQQCESVTQTTLHIWSWHLGKCVTLTDKMYLVKQIVGQMHKIEHSTAYFN